jgi:hypothetical protein
MQINWSAGIELKGMSYRQHTDYVPIKNADNLWSHEKCEITVQTLSNTLSTDTVRGIMSLKKYKSRGKAIEATLNSKDENS